MEDQIGSTVLALSNPRQTAQDAPTPGSSVALPLAFKVPVAAVDSCAAELMDQQIAFLSPPSDRDFGHRTLFFRDPDGNLLEMFAEI